MLFPFQVEGAEWLTQRPLALLADEMGLGKTVQAIRASDIVQTRSVLVVCPAVARINWAREFKQWSNGRAKVQFVSFEFVNRRSTELKSPELLIVDEVHFAKSLSAQRSKAIFGKGGLAHRSERVWALSGTPAPNHAGELWILLYSFGVTRLKYQDFVNYFCVTVATGFGDGFKIVGTKMEKVAELRALLAQIMLRRMKRDVMKDLPPLFYSTTVVEAGEVSHLDLTAEDFRKLTIEVEALDLKLSSSKDEISLLEALAQSVSTLRRYTGLQKVDPAFEMISGELACGLLDKVVIFAIHQRVIERLYERLSKVTECVVVNGSVMPELRQARIDAYQKDPKVKVFIGNIQAAGTNLTLTAAHQVVFVEYDWVPGNNAQAAMRCHRIGQKASSVNVRFLSLANPIDERITKVVRRKTEELSSLLD